MAKDLKSPKQFVKINKCLERFPACVSVSGQPRDSRGGPVEASLHLGAGKHRLQRRTARRMAALQTDPHGEGQGGHTELDYQVVKLGKHIRGSHHISSFLHRR